MNFSECVLLFQCTRPTLESLGLSNLETSSRRVLIVRICPLNLPQSIQKCYLIHPGQCHERRSGVRPYLWQIRLIPVIILVRNKRSGWAKAKSRSVPTAHSHTFLVHVLTGVRLRYQSSSVVSCRRRRRRKAASRKAVAVKHALSGSSRYRASSTLHCTWSLWHPYISHILCVCRRI